MNQTVRPAGYRGTKLWLLSLLFWGLLTAPTAQAADILIYSSSHKNQGTTQVKQPSGTLVLQVSSFSKILQVTLNGQPVPFKGTDVAEVKAPYQLEKGINRLEIEVSTEEGSLDKTFILAYGEAPQRQASPPTPSQPPTPQPNGRFKLQRQRGAGPK
ncbi:MAG: hypothetical protein RRB13_12030 [bacterium]|nr:hypothetical protein [bacterium]